jgi:hypothetical protein
MAADFVAGAVKGADLVREFLRDLSQDEKRAADLMFRQDC